MRSNRPFETMPAQAAASPALAGPLYMDAELRPNRSLPNVGFYALMAAVCVVGGVASVFYLAMGAWPVVGFFGLDIALVWLAFKVSYRQGRLMELVRVSAGELYVARRHPTGHTQHWTLSPHWSRVDIDTPVRHESQVRVRSHGRTLILGAFLAPEERGGFAKALALALERARDERFPGAPQGSGGHG